MLTDKKPEDFQLSNAEAAEYFNKEILPKLHKRHDFSEKKEPIAFFTGGLPGAGKSKIVEMLERENPKIPVIDVDELRKYHPYSDVIQKLFGEKASSITHPDAIKFAYLFKEEIFKNRSNYVLDSTLRTPKSAEIEIGQALKQGYNAKVIIVAVHEFESFQGAFSRYTKQLERNPAEARFVEPAFIKEGALTITDSVELIDNLPIKEFKIVSRNQEIIYNKGDSKIDAKTALEKYNNPKNWQKSRAEQLIKDFTAIVNKLEYLNAPKKIIDSSKSIMKEIENKFSQTKKKSLFPLMGEKRGLKR